jgi:hypothetical protein
MMDVPIHFRMSQINPLIAGKPPDQTFRHETAETRNDIQKNHKNIWFENTLPLDGQPQYQDRH